MVGQSVFYSDRRLEAQRPEVLMLWAHRNTVADSGGDLFTVSAGPFGEVFVGVSEDYFNRLPCHVLNDTSPIPGNESK